jgi:purine-cytosine permease-like protein
MSDHEDRHGHHRHGLDKAVADTLEDLGHAAPAHGTVPSSRLGVVETLGIDTIPEADRTSTPSHVAHILIGSAMGFAAIVLGWLPVAWGLSWWATVTAITLGAVIGCIILAPMGNFGPRTGTNNPVSSGAHFGVKGRLVGTLAAQLSTIGFTAISIWTGGQAVVAGLNRLFSLPVNNWTLSVGYAVIGFLTVLICVYGFGSLLFIQRVAVVGVGAIMILGLLAFAPKFDAGFPGTGDFLLGTFTSTWVLSVIAVAANPISYGPVVGDWARYVSGRYGPRAMMPATFIGGFIGLWCAPIFGAYTAVCFKDPTTDYVTGLIATSPGWYVVPLIVVGFLGGLVNGSSGLYGTGLDTSSLVPRLTRVQATVFISAVTMVFVYVGTLVWNVLDSLSAFLTIMTITITPWMIVNIIGYWHRRGYYNQEDLQVFNRRQTGGVYWFTGGLNYRAVTAWFVATVVGILFSNTSFWTGPYANAANGVDLSFTSAAVISAVLYLIILRVFPEPAGVFGPQRATGATSLPVDVQTAPGRADA